MKYLLGMITGLCLAEIGLERIVKFIESLWQLGESYVR